MHIFSKNSQRFDSELDKKASTNGTRFPIFVGLSSIKVV